MTKVLLKTTNLVQLIDLNDCKLTYDIENKHIMLSYLNKIYFYDTINQNLSQVFENLITEISCGTLLVDYISNSLFIEEKGNQTLTMNNIFLEEIKYISEFIKKELSNKPFVTPNEILNSENLKDLFFEHKISKGSKIKTIPQLINDCKLKDVLSLNHLDISFNYLDKYDTEKSNTYKIYFLNSNNINFNFINENKLLEQLENDIINYYNSEEIKKILYYSVDNQRVIGVTNK